MPRAFSIRVKQVLLNSIVFSFILIDFVMASRCFGANDNHADSVVKIFVTSNSMDYYRPWQSQGSQATSGSGAIIQGRKIITNAHVVADHTFIQVRKESNPKKYTARVLAIGHDCDLAILTVDDPDFFDQSKPLSFGELPKLQDSVAVIGFPLGGDKLSITEGVVSRVEIVPYVQSSKRLLGVQIDAAINPGNSGGPVVQDGKIVGIAMQSMMRSQNIGYMIPTPVIQHFLKDLDDTHYDGFPTLGIEFHSTENKALRKYFQIQDREGGVLITHVHPFFPAHGILKEDDIVVAVDNIEIGVDGTFEFRKQERLGLSYLVNNKQTGDNIQLKIIRDGKTSTEEIKLIPYDELVPQPHHTEKPSYYIYGGFVFTVLSMDLLKSWDNEDDGRFWNNSPLDFLYYVVGNGRLNSDNKREIVILLNVLPDDISVGYHEYYNKFMTKVNGRKFDSFKEFVMILEENTDPYTILETEDELKVIINSQDIETVTASILQRNNIPMRSSDDVHQWIKEAQGKTQAASIEAGEPAGGKNKSL